MFGHHPNWSGMEKPTETLSSPLFFSTYNFLFCIYFLPGHPFFSSSFSLSLSLFLISWSPSTHTLSPSKPARPAALTLDKAVCVFFEGVCEMTADRKQRTMASATDGVTPNIPYSTCTHTHTHTHTHTRTKSLLHDYENVSSAGMRADVLLPRQ